MIKYTMITLNMMYIMVFSLFLITPFIDINLWLCGIAFGWLFHWIVGSVIIHRYITHATFKVNRFLHNTFTLLSTIAYTGSALSWASMHRMHHRTSDTIKDPHSPEKYTWWQTILLILAPNTNLKDRELELLYCKDLLIDRLHLFCHRYYVPINLLFVLALGLISIKLLIAFWIGIAYHSIGMLVEAWVYHKKLVFQYKSHDTEDSSYNNVITTFLFHGEAYHNNHHKTPGATSNAERWYEFDMNNLVINLLKTK